MSTAPDAPSAAPATTSALPSPKCCAYHAKRGPEPRRSTTSSPVRAARNAAPATRAQSQMHQVLRLPRFQHCQKRCAYHEKRGPETRARQHPAQVEQVEMLPLPHEHSPRCTACCACHDSALPSPKCCAYHAKKGPAARSNIQPS